MSRGERQKDVTDRYRENYDSIFKKDATKRKVARVDGGSILPVRKVGSSPVLDEVATESGGTQTSEA